MRTKLFADGNTRIRVKSKLVGQKLWLHLNGETYVVDQQPVKKKKASSSASDHLENQILSPMPGKVLRIQVKLGDKVFKDQVLIVLEAMKMEYSLLAPCDGTIEQLECKELEQIELGRLLVKIK